MSDDHIIGMTLICAIAGILFILILGSSSCQAVQTCLTSPTAPTELCKKIIDDEFRRGRKE